MQRVEGVSYTSYLRSPAEFDRVFTSVIASAASVSTDSIMDLVVRDGTSAARTAPAARVAPTNLRATIQDTSGDGLGLQYTIQVPVSSGVTYEQLSTQLTTSVESGQFSTQLQQYAAEQDVPELASASTSSIDTQNTSPPVGASHGTVDGLSAAAVAGIVIGVLAAMLLCLFVAFRVYVQRAPERSGFQDLNSPRGKGLFTSTWVSSPMHQEPGEQ